MKAEITARGVLQLIPENSTEEWAAKQWHERNRVDVRDMLRDENFYLCGSALVVQLVDAGELSATPNLDAWAKATANSKRYEAKS